MSTFRDLLEGDNYNKITDKAMREFAKGLEKLSKKTGIWIETTGGISYTDPKKIKSVSYSDDFSSSDISCKVTV